MLDLYASFLGEAQELTLCPFGYLQKWTNAERYKLIQVADERKLDRNILAAVIKIESGGDPAIKNPSSGASGLIQWMPGEKGSAQAIHHTTTTAIRQMNICSQLDLVRDYYKHTLPNGAKTPGDEYVAVSGGPYPEGSPGAKANPGWDLNKDGAVSLDEIRSLALGVKNAACASGPSIIVTPEECTPSSSRGGFPWTIALVGALGAGVWYAWDRGLIR
jgi:hypothetical protein